MPLKLPDDTLSEEEVVFRDTLRRFYEENAPMTQVRSVMDSERGIDAALWSQASQELGLPAIAIEEAWGGQGFGLRALAIALAESGRALAPVPLLATAGLAARAIQHVTSGPDREEWLAPLAAGQVATLAWVEAAGDWGPGSVSTWVDDAGRLHGEKRFVLDGGDAERFFVIARTSGTTGSGDVGLYGVDAGASGLSVRREESLDPTRKLATLRLDGAAARPVGTRASAEAGLRRALGEATVLLCAEMVGSMERVLEAAVDHASTRYQFGRPIGSFQAIKHKCADMLIDFEGARTVASAAVEAFDATEEDASDAVPSRSEASLLTSVAKAHVGPAYVRMATENIQIHGGVGYTWEYDAHLFFRRAHSGALFLGDAALHQENLARLLGDTMDPVEASESQGGSPVAQGGPN